MSVHQPRDTGCLFRSGFLEPLFELWVLILVWSSIQVSAPSHRRLLFCIGLTMFP